MLNSMQIQKFFKKSVNLDYVAELGAVSAL